MSQIYKSIYKRWNGLDFDDHYLKTSADIVVETSSYKIMTAAERSLINTYLGDGDSNPDTPSYLNISQNFVLAAPSSSAGAPAYRALVAADIPSLGYLPLTGGTVTANTVFEEGIEIGHEAPIGDLASSNSIVFDYYNSGELQKALYASNAGNLIFGGQALATESYVDALISVGTKPAPGGPVYVATTENITLSGLQTIDGISVTDAKRVLVKDQTVVSENGIYLSSPGAWTKVAADSVEGLLVFVSNGDTQNDWLYYNEDGTTWVEFSRVDTIEAGSGLTKVGTTISIATSGVTNSMLAGSIAWSKLVSQTALDNASVLFDTWGEIANASVSSDLTTRINGILASIGLLRGTPNFNTNNTQTIAELYKIKPTLEVGAVVRLANFLGNVTLSGSQTIDSVSAADGDLVLVADQTISSENGIYEVNDSGSWLKLSSLQENAFYVAEEGTSNRDKLYQYDGAGSFTTHIDSLGVSDAGLAIISLV